MGIRITEEQKITAIEKYKEYGNMSLAASAINMNRKTLQREMGRSAAFKADMGDAKAAYCARLEQILDERIKSPEGDKASALLLMFKMKAEMPDKYRERIEHKVDGDIKIITGVPRPEK